MPALPPLVEQALDLSGTEAARVVQRLLDNSVRLARLLGEVMECTEQGDIPPILQQDIELALRRHAEVLDVEPSPS